MRIVNDDTKPDFKTKCYVKNKFNESQIGSVAHCGPGNTLVSFKRDNCTLGHRRAFCLKGRPGTDFVTQEDLDNCAVTDNDCTSVRQITNKIEASDFNLEAADTTTREGCCSALLNLDVINENDISKADFKSGCLPKATVDYYYSLNKTAGRCGDGNTALGVARDTCNKGYRRFYCKKGQSNGKKGWIFSKDIGQCDSKMSLTRDNCLLMNKGADQEQESESQDKKPYSSQVREPSSSQGREPSVPPQNQNTYPPQEEETTTSSSNLRKYLLYGGIALVILLVIVGVVIFIRKRQQQLPTFPKTRIDFDGPFNFGQATGPDPQYAQVISPY